MLLQEPRRQASFAPEPLGFFHFRDRDDFEVDIVIEPGPAEIAGVILYDGSATICFGDGLYAVPIRSLWETT